MKERPIGVIVVAVLTMFIALAFGLLQLLIGGLMSVGGPPSSPSGLPPYVIFPSLVAALSFVLSIGQFGGKRWAWYGSIVFWALFLVAFGWFAYHVNFFGGYGSNQFLFLLLPLVYAVGCITYFLTRNAREYFFT